MFDQRTIAFFERRATPFYYYDMELLHATLKQLQTGLKNHGIKAHYAIKANVQKPLLEAIASYGLGADCVSAEEIKVALKAGFKPRDIFFAGVGKTDSEIRFALKAGVGCFNVESVPELQAIDAIAARLGAKAHIALRINPDIDAHTHKYISTGLEENKFGISRPEFAAVQQALRRSHNLEFEGLHFHVGSQILDMEVFALLCQKAGQIVEQFSAQGFNSRIIDLGGGLGVDYLEPDLHPVPDFEGLLRTIRANIQETEGQQVHIEPGRSVVAQCGSLISRAVFVKEGQKKKFLILDAGMNDLIRPALYGAYHSVQNLTPGPGAKEEVYDIVGPVCESSDTWGEGRIIPAARRGDLFAIRSAGAYGQTMSMKYNCRKLAKAYYSDNLD